jgi:hypothetical protein
LKLSLLLFSKVSEELHHFLLSAFIMRSQFLSSILVGVVAFFVTAHAYGAVGHRTIGYLAEKWLDAHAAKVFGKLLSNNKGFDFSDAAVWADKARDQGWLTWDTAPWHYVNNLQDNPPKGNCSVSWGDCPKNEGCILRAIINQVCQLLPLCN